MWADALAGAKVCVSVRACVCVSVCVGGCVGTEESKGFHLKEGEEILSGKAERRMEREMFGSSCKWEEQYGGQWQHHVWTPCKCQMCF